MSFLSSLRSGLSSIGSAIRTAGRWLRDNVFCCCFARNVELDIETGPLPMPENPAQPEPVVIERLKKPRARRQAEKRMLLLQAQSQKCSATDIVVTSGNTKKTVTVIVKPREDGTGGGRRDIKKEPSKLTPERFTRFESSVHQEAPETREPPKKSPPPKPKRTFQASKNLTGTEPPNKE